MKAHRLLAWYQLRSEKLRMLAAVAGIAFAVVLMLGQLGFEDALFLSVTRIYTHMKPELMMISPQFQFMVSTRNFNERRLYQTLGDEAVDWVAALYFGTAHWKNPVTRKDHNIFVIAFKPRPGLFDIPGIDDRIADIEKPDQYLIDDKSRSEFGPIPDIVRREGSMSTELSSWTLSSGHRVHVVGVFSLGPSFGVDGNLITSYNNLLNIDRREPGIADMGLIKLKPGYDADQVAARLDALLEPEVRVVTRQGLIDVELRYWADNSPVGFIFTLGLLMGLIVGAVVVYQILYSDISGHLSEYATLKALGYSDWYLLGVVLQEALILSLLGFVPGIGLAKILFIVAERATMLTMQLSYREVGMVYLLTAGMCTVSGALAVRRLKAADPASIFK